MTGIPVDNLTDHQAKSKLHSTSQPIQFPTVRKRGVARFCGGPRARRGRCQAEARLQTALEKSSSQSVSAFSRAARSEREGGVRRGIVFGGPHDSRLLTRAALSTSGCAKSKFLSAKVKSGCSEGGSPSSLGPKIPRV